MDNYGGFTDVTGKKNGIFSLKIHLITDLNLFQRKKSKYESNKP